MTHRLSLVLVLAALLTAAAQGQEINEYQMKAAYLYNFAKFVEWPAEAFKDASHPIEICIVGQSPILRALEEAVSGEMIESRKLIVRQISDLKHVNSCRILFIGLSDRKNTRSILRELKTTGILTVGETDGFTSEGGVANFKLTGNKVRIEINMNAALQQKLRISPKLLSLAQIVRD